jgi:aminoglycoside phosphotransferase (APT) family kinase protein
MSSSNATIEAQITLQLSRLLGLEITNIRSEYQERGSPGTVLKLSAINKAQEERFFILKMAAGDRDYRFYKHYLEPYNLDSPKQYGYIEPNGQRFLVMDYIRHVPPNWGDGDRYLEAVKWLIKKDLVTSQHLDSIRKLDCLEEMDYYGIEYWLPIFQKWHNDSASSQARDIWSIVSRNQHRIHQYVSDLSQTGAQTVVHGDLQMDNVLFAEAGGEIFVIDWTEPHLSSVTKDLASLYDNAPIGVKDQLIDI